MRDAYLRHLAQVPLFAGLPKDALEAIARQATPLNLDPGHVLLHQGSAAHELVVVVEGQVRVEQDGRSIATLGPGSVIGELAILLDRPRNATVIAEGPIEVLVIDRRAFWPLLEEIPGLATSLLVTVAHRLAGDAPAPHQA